MNIQEAIAELGKGISVHPSSRCGEAVTVLLAEYKQLHMTVEGFAPKLLEEMRAAADWQAVASRMIALLKNRNKPGMAEVIDDVLKKIEAQSKPPAAVSAKEETPPEAGSATILQFPPKA